MLPMGRALDYVEQVENILVIKAVRSGDRFRQWLYVGNYSVNRDVQPEALEYYAAGKSPEQAAQEIMNKHS